MRCLCKVGKERQCIKYIIEKSHTSLVTCDMSRKMLKAVSELKCTAAHNQIPYTLKYLKLYKITHHVGNGTAKLLDSNHFQ